MLFSKFIAPRMFDECFLYGSLIMQADFEMPGTDIAAIRIETSGQQADPETDNERTIVANENGMGWPLVPFPER